jgi:hypothetical protein
MPMLSLQERHDLRTSRIARFYEMESQFELVTYFYPARKLTIYVDQFAIMSIMNYDAEEAKGLLRKIGKEVGNEFCPRVRTSVFCDHMDIDEMLVQLFLASLDSYDEPLPPGKRLPAISREEIEAEQRPRKVHELAELLRDGIMENTKTLALRAMLWEEANPNGEAMFKRKKWVQMVIRAFEVAQIYGCHIKTAQIMLRDVRKKELEEYPDSKLRRYVSIKKFCAVHFEDEEDLRKRLAELHGDDDDDDDDEDDD